VQASKVQEVAKKAAAVAATLPAFVAASPAFALVRERRGLSGGWAGTRARAMQL
jgi:hypothetical protein